VTGDQNSTSHQNLAEVVVGAEAVAGAGPEGSALVATVHRQLAIQQPRDLQPGAD
jgi:hypothetical protein